MIVFSCDVTAVWSSADWSWLAGKQVRVAVNGIWDDGIVARVAFGDSPYGTDDMVTVVWMGGGSFGFSRVPGAEVTVGGDVR